MRTNPHNVIKIAKDLERKELAERSYNELSEDQVSPESLLVQYLSERLNIDPQLIKDVIEDLISNKQIAVASIDGKRYFKKIPKF